VGTVALTPEMAGQLLASQDRTKGLGRGMSPILRVRRALAELLCPELRREAAEDPLTGALNRRADEAATARALTERCDGTRLLRFQADLDNFKVLNDAYGHQAGDAALCLVRHSLEQATRDADLVSLARPGGDEFALTLRVAVHADPEAIRDRIEQTVNDALAHAGLREVGRKRVGLSVGVVDVNGSPTIRELDAAADAAARERKRARGESQPRRRAG
jgi:diguanylate cyclase (GGDEF)-like protein